LSQVTSLTLSGSVNDHALSMLPVQFSGLQSLQVLGSYYVSDWGLKKLSKAPHLAALLLQASCRMTHQSCCNDKLVKSSVACMVALLHSKEMYDWVCGFKLRPQNINPPPSYWRPNMPN
jgi:hypothetical protein